MPRLCRVHFASVGHRDARLDPLTLDLRGGDGRPADSVVWLRNGGGKSSVLNLLFSIFQPNLHAFLGRNVEGQSRHLTDYVKATDLACIVTEWETDAPDLFGSATRRVVGQLMAWRGQQRSADAGRLQRVFFSFKVDDALTFDDLPTPGLGTPATTLDDFRGWLRAADQARPGREVVLEDQQRRWTEHLADLRLDPELFRYQLEMNRREGAADELFRFTSARAFVDFFLELALDTARADEVSANLDLFRDKLARQPTLRIERALAVAARAKLGPLVVALEAREEAVAERGAAASAAAALRAALEAAGAASIDAAAAHAVDAERLAGTLKTLGNDARRFDRYAAGLTRRAVELACAEARAALDAALARRDEAATAVRALAAVAELRQVRTLEAQRASLQAELSRLRVDRRPALDALRAEGDALVAALGVAIGALDDDLAAAAERLEAVDAERSAARAARDAAVRARAEAEAQGKALREQIAGHDRARDKLLTDALLESREDAEVALARWTAAADAASARAADATAKADDADAKANAADAARAEARETLAARRVERDQARATFEQARALREALQRRPCIVEVEEVEEADVFAADLTRRLHAEAGRFEARRLQLVVDGAEDARAQEALEATGLLPPPVEVSRVVERLQAAGVDAFPAWAWLAENLQTDLEAKRRLVEADPARFAGVLVKPQDLERAAAVEGLDADLRAPVTIAPLGLEADAAEARHVVGPGEAGGFDHAAAVHGREVLEARVAARDRQVSEAAERAATLRTAAEDVRRFVREWGEGRYDAAAERADALVAEAEALQARVAELDATVRAQRERAVAARAVAREAEAQAAEAARSAVRLDDFVERWARPLAGWRDALAEARAATERAEQAAQAAQAREETLGSERDRLRAERVRRLSAREDRVAERDRVEHRAGADVASPPPLDAQRRRYGEQLRRFEQQYGDERLQGQLDEVGRSLEVFQARLRRAARELPGGAVDAADARAGAQLEAEVSRAEGEAEGARQAVAGAELALRQADQARAELSRLRREAEDLPPDEEAPPTAEASRARAAHWRGEADAVRAQVRDLEEQERRAKAAQEAAERSAERREQQARRVAEACRVEVAEEPSALPQDDAAIEARVASVIERHRETTAAVDAADEAVQARVEAVRQVALDPTYAEHTSAVKERLLSPAEALTARAAEWDRSLEQRLAALDDELRTIEQDRAMLLEGLVAVTDDALRLLADLERGSRMPASLGKWAGRPFLQVRLDAPATADEKKVRLEPLVDALVEQATIPRGLELVQRAVDHLRGRKPIEATILKPEAARRTERVGIASMVNFSGGERLTAAVLLYCTLVHLRARRRGQRGAPTGNVLVLDNPIGTCSSVPLIELQREVARAMNMQLVYTTGVDDLAALAQLPNTVRLRNVHRNVRTGDLHVTIEEGAVEGARVVATEESAE